MQGIRHLLTPQTICSVQSAIVAGARRFVGTYGGFAYLAPLCGVPAVSYYSEPEPFSKRHLDLIRDVLRVEGRPDLLTSPRFGRRRAADGRRRTMAMRGRIGSANSGRRGGSSGASRRDLERAVEGIGADSRRAVALGSRLRGSVLGTIPALGEGCLPHSDLSESSSCREAARPAGIGISARDTSRCSTMRQPR